MMNSNKFEYSVLAYPDDIHQIASILEQCFILSSGEQEIVVNNAGIENYRVIHEFEQIIGGLGIVSIGQWWCGQRVPMTAISLMGIAPEYRHSGAATALLQHTLKELYAKEVSTSAVFPSTQHVYRKVGYEMAGSSCIWEIPTQSIQVREQPLPLQSVDISNYEVFNDLYLEQARLTHGCLDRNVLAWQTLIRPKAQETVYGYLIGVKDQYQGYIIFNQEETKNGAILHVRDWVVLTHNAALSFWSFLASHRSMIKKVQWKSSVIDSQILLLPEQTAKIRYQNYWMLRIIDLVKALETRGYPCAGHFELHMEVKDDLLSNNNGKFILSIADGRGKVTRGGKGEFQLDIRGLAPLYTSLFNPYQLQLAGKIVATKREIQTATQIFAGMPPWIGWR